jgi:hypothetical protein
MVGIDSMMLNIIAQLKIMKILIINLTYILLFNNIVTYLFTTNKIL